MKRVTKWAAALLAAVLLTALFAGCGAKDTKDGKLHIVATIFPVYEWVKNITKDADNVDVSLLLDKGVDMHSFQPTTKDIVRMSDCDVFVYVGGESDEWAEDVLRNARNKNMLTVNLMEAMGSAAKEEEAVEGMEAEKTDEKEYDEHIWLSLKNAAALSRTIADKLGEKDTAHKTAYDANAKAYIEQLQALDGQYTQTVTAAKNKTLIFADRFPFRYLTDDYGLSYYAAFSGCSAESEASFQTLVFLAEKLKELHLNKLVILDGSTPKMAQSVIDASGLPDVEICTLNSMQSNIGENETYLGIMKDNLSVLQTALN